MSNIKDQEISDSPIVVNPTSKKSGIDKKA